MHTQFWIEKLVEGSILQDLNAGGRIILRLKCTVLKLRKYERD